MTYPSPTVDELRAAFRDHGCTLVEVRGCTSRFRYLWQHGLRAMVDHHTAGVGDGVMAYMENRSGRYPFCNSSVRRNGEVWVFAYGSAWGSGDGTWPGTPKVWADDLLHEVAWQTEVESMGQVRDFTDVQLEALGRQNAALVDLGVPAENEINHRDWAPTRKVDTRYDAVFLRANTARYVIGDDMALSDDDVQRIAEAVWTRVVDADGDKKMGALLRATYLNTRKSTEVVAPPAEG